MKAALLLVVFFSACYAAPLKWKVPPPAHFAYANRTDNAPPTSSNKVGPAYVDRLQGSVAYINEAHNGRGWNRVFIQSGTNSVCWQAASVYWTPKGNVAEVGCEVQYDHTQNGWFLNAFSGIPGSDSWCTARCLNWVNM